MSLVLKHGVEAKNYADLAKAEKLKPLEVELRRLEDLSDSIVQDFMYMRQREEEMRSTNGGSLSASGGFFCEFRVHEHSRPVPERLLNALPADLGRLADPLPAPLLQGQEAHRLISLSLFPNLFIRVISILSSSRC